MNCGLTNVSHGGNPPLPPYVGAIHELPLRGLGGLKGELKNA
jgi:hypothetical protein